MTLTADESRALAFIAGLLFLSAAVRLASLPERIEVPGELLDLDAHIAATERAVGEAERMAKPLAPGERLDPNTAPAVELARLPRVGPALAARIVEDRERQGPFRRTADLARVPGVGPRLIELATPHLTLPEGPPGAARGAAAQRPQGAAVSPTSHGAAVPRSRGAAAPPTSRGAAAPPTSHGAAVPPSAAAPPVLDLNTATAAALESLPGVGPVLAERIVAHRDSVGRFNSVDDLLSVRGIGEATLERIRPRIRAGP